MLIVQRCRAHWRLLALLGALALGILVGSAGSGAAVERSLQEVAWQLRERPASGALHIVEIDARSVAAIDRWPWPRGHHAQLIDRLQEAGAATIAFDVDFSARSSAAGDRALAAALARAGGKVVLPTFRQHAGAGSDGWIDSLPAAPLRDHAVAAAVNVLADDDGLVRRVPVGTITAGVPRPSLSAMIAGQGGSAGSHFPIDFAIDPGSIPRHSFVDIRDGRFDPADIAGKHVLIGATAVEMGDRYVVPLRGVLSGVVVQALAVETLWRGLPGEAGWPLSLVPAILLAWGIVSRRSRGGLAVATVGAPLALFAMAVIVQATLNWYLQIVPALAILAGASGAAIAMRLVSAARRRLLHDAETGLPNRLALEDALRGAGEAGVVAARIVEFDKLAAGLGRAGASELVQRIRDRVSLIGADVVYRVEDRVLAWRCDGEDQLEPRLTALRTLMRSPVEVRGRRVDVALALGYAMGSGTHAGQIVANAALAADRAKTTNSALHVHRSSDDEQVERELSLLGELDEALGSDQIQVLYQPKLDILTGRIVSVEALVRWHHATRGLLGPDQFIPLAERNERIAGLTLHVLARTMTDLATWHAAGHRLSGAVNLSATLLGSPPFISELRQMIDASPVPPGHLIFEVTESAAVDDPEAAAAALRSFRELGIRISMDDYGTGQSTLSYLKELPLNELKIDQSFVRQAHRNRADAVLVRSTVDLAHELGLKVVAEGVEDAECLAYLRTIGCDMAQGYLIGRPMPAIDLVGRLGQDAAQAA